MFDPEKKDSEQIGAGLVQLVQAMVLAVQEGWLGPDTAKRIIDAIVTRMGVEVDTDKKVEDLLADKEQRDADSAAKSAYAGRPPAAAFGGNGGGAQEPVPAAPQESEPIKILQTFQPAPVMVQIERKAKLSEAKFDVQRDASGRITSVTRKAKED
jgi:hypothetical protein